MREFFKKKKKREERILLSLEPCPKNKNITLLFFETHKLKVITLLAM
jgi:hypothetical protein